MTLAVSDESSERKNKNTTAIILQVSLLLCWEAALLGE
jgi:hypothetical protein